MSDGKKTVIHVLDVCLFCVLTFFVLWGISFICERKESRIQYSQFLEEPEKLDVLFIGDSHSVNAYYPMELWEDYGIPSYNLSGIGNTMPVSYWSLRLALQYAKPKVVVVCVKDCGFEGKLTGSSGDVHTMMDFFPLNMLKVQAVLDLMDNPLAVDDDGNFFEDMRIEYLLTLAKYHMRWPELSPADFSYEPSVQKGGQMRIGRVDPQPYEITDEIGDENEGFGYLYLRKIIELCQAQGIDVVLTDPPYPAEIEQQMSDAVAYYIAEEYGIPYIDFVNMDCIVDYQTDMYDSFSHLNPSGARKVTDYIGVYLRDHYDLPDHRQDTAYATWQSEYEEYMQYKKGHINLQADNIQNLLMLLHDMHLSVCFLIPENSRIYDDEELLLLIQNIARPHLHEEDEGWLWADGLFPLERLENAGPENSYFFLHDRKADELIESAGEAVETDTSFGHVLWTAESGLKINDENMLWDDSADLNLTIIDDTTGEIFKTVSYHL